MVAFRTLASAVSSQSMVQTLMAQTSAVGPLHATHLSSSIRSNMIICRHIDMIYIYMAVVKTRSPKLYLRLSCAIMGARGSKEA